MSAATVTLGSDLSHRCAVWSVRLSMLISCFVSGSWRKNQEWVGLVLLVSLEKLEDLGEVVDHQAEVAATSQPRAWNLAYLAIMLMIRNRDLIALFPSAHHGVPCSLSSWKPSLALLSWIPCPSYWSPPPRCWSQYSRERRSAESCHFWLIMNMSS